MGATVTAPTGPPRNCLGKVFLFAASAASFHSYPAPPTHRPTDPSRRPTDPPAHRATALLPDLRAQLGPVMAEFYDQLPSALALFRALFGDFNIDAIMDNSSGYLNALLFLGYLCAPLRAANPSPHSLTHSLTYLLAYLLTCSSREPEPARQHAPPPSTRVTRLLTFAACHR